MPYRAAPEPPSHVHRLRFRPASAYVAPALVALASIVIAASSVYRTFAAVRCVPSGCAIHRPSRIGRMSDPLWNPIPCTEADAAVLSLAAPAPLVRHTIIPGAPFDVDPRTLESARFYLAMCVNQDPPHARANVTVEDVRLDASAAWLGAGIALAIALAALGWTRGLHVEIDEGRRLFRSTERRIGKKPRSFSCDLREVASVAVERHTVEGHEYVACALRSGELAVIAQGTGTLDRRRYARAATRIKAALGGAAEG